MITEGNLYRVGDNNETCLVGHITDIVPFPDFDFLDEYILDKVIKPYQPREFSCTMSDTNRDIWKSLCQPMQTADQFMLVIERTVQRRKHHKRRINKKWIKRYGYKTFYEKYDIDTSGFNFGNSKPFNPSDITATFLIDKTKMTGELYSNIKIV